ncbi:unnamed protein product [Arctia plantaginis]|nr:unnamed protein product [Arctia plantaginis]
MKVSPTIEPIFIAPINNIINLTIPSDKDLNFTLSTTPLLKELERKIKDLEKESAISEENDMSIHDIHHYTLIYGLWGVSIIAASVYLCRRVRCRRQAAAASSAAAEADRCRPESHNSVLSSARVIVNECSAQVKSEPCYKDRGTSPVLKKISFSEPL